MLQDVHGKFQHYKSSDQGKMIEIAESMKDLNAVRGNTFKPYEYVAIYEQALGFDTKEFPSTPSGWMFTDVSAYFQPACVNVSYAAQKEIGWLFLSQCHTNMDRYAGYDIPRAAIERVQIGNNAGQYIRLCGSR